VSEYIRDIGPSGELFSYARGTFNLAGVKSKGGIYAGRMIFLYLYSFYKLF